MEIRAEMKHGITKRLKQHHITFTTNKGSIESNEWPTDKMLLREVGMF